MRYQYRRNDGVEMDNLNHARQTVDRAREVFEGRLRHFVREWSPDNDRDRYEMQTQLSILMRDAMQLQNATFSLGIDRYVSQQLEQSAIASAYHGIFDKGDKP